MTVCVRAKNFILRSQTTAIIREYLYPVVSGTNFITFSPIRTPKNSANPKRMPIVNSSPSRFLEPKRVRKYIFVKQMHMMHNIMWV